MERDEQDLQPPEGEEEEEQTPDPLAELPEDPEARRAKLDEYLNSERERIAAEAREAAEAELQKHKAAVNAGAKQRLADRFGIEWGDDGEFKVTDPLRALANLQGAPAKPEETPRPDPVYDPEGYDKWNEQRAEQKAEAKLAPVLEELKTLRGLLVSQQTQSVDDRGREILDGLGIGHWAEHPGFQDAYRSALAQMPPQQLQDPKALRFATLAAVGMLDDAQLPKPRDPGTGRFTAAEQAARAGLQQARSPRGYNGRPAPTSFTDEQRAVAELAGMSVEEYAKYGPQG